MDFYLRVNSPFPGHDIGDLIMDPKLIEEIQADHRAHWVVRVAAVPDPEPVREA